MTCEAAPALTSPPCPAAGSRAWSSAPRPMRDDQQLSVGLAKLRLHLPFPIYCPNQVPCSKDLSVWPLPESNMVYKALWVSQKGDSQGWSSVSVPTGVGLCPSIQARFRPWHRRVPLKRNVWLFLTTCAKLRSNGDK